MAEVSFREAGRRYRRLFWPTMAFYTVICLGGAMVHRMLDHPAPWISAIFAVMTAAPAVGVFWMLGRFVAETDEYTRKIHVEAMLTGGGIVLSLSIVWGFLELYEAVQPVTDFPLVMLMGLGFFLFYGAAFIVQQLRRGETLWDTLRNDPACLRKD